MITNEYFVLHSEDYGYLKGKYGDSVFDNYYDAKEKQQEWNNGPTGKKYQILKRTIIEEVQE
jgi:hypothetical protein